MKFVKSHTDNPKRKWLDSRLFSPSPNSYETYDVIFVSNGFAFIGRAGWMPTDQYTNGVWEKCSLRSGQVGGEAQVLYWMQKYNKVPSAIQEDYSELLEIKPK